MYSKKEIILQNINMADVLREYGIKRKGEYFCCPFHNDKSPSAKCNKKTYYCFACGEHGDLIQFVENYFELDFLSAMEKLNIDFNLNIPENNKIDKSQLEELKTKRLLLQMEEQEKKRKQKSRLLAICNLEKSLKSTYKQLREQINPYNWEEIEYLCSIILQEIEELDYEFEELNVKI